MPLRTRLVLLLVFLVAVALIALDAISFSSLQSQLLQPVDQELQQSSRQFAGFLSQPFGNPGDLCTTGVAYDTSFSLYSPSGSAKGTFTCPRGAPSPPTVPASLISSVGSSSSSDGLFSTVAGGRYRTLAVPISYDLHPYVAVTTVSLASVNGTLSYQLHRDLIVSLAVLLVLALAAWALVRWGLRPLDRMAETAGEIAAGDLTRRVEDTDARTEVGQLGTALNIMLSQIEKAFRQREESERQLRRFVADASHELRTPLTSIRGYAELFRNGRARDPDDLAKALRRIESESERMGGLVEDMLLLARLDQGRPLEHEPVDLALLAADAVEDARVIGPGRQVSLIGSGPVVVNGDERRLRQVVGNLVANAVTHTPAGSPIEIATAGDTGSGMSTLAVIDHGPGIPIDDLPHVFERFWRADQSRQRAKGGAGLGLSIVAAVVAAHGGQVRAVATPNGGATFVLELPTALPRRSEVPAEAPAEAPD